MSKSILIMIAVLALFIIGKYFYFQPNYTTGDKASDFSVNINGKTTRLSNLRGNYVLLDFWGSWCPPCLKENPQLVQLYDEFNGQKFIDGDGFEIFSIGLETNEVNWKSAIKRFGLRWPYHYSDFKRMKSPIAIEYGVREIPAKFLINPNGNIIRVNSSVNELRTILISKLKK